MTGRIVSDLKINLDKFIATSIIWPIPGNSPVDEPFEVAGGKMQIVMEN